MGIVVWVQHISSPGQSQPPTGGRGRESVGPSFRKEISRAPWATVRPLGSDRSVLEPWLGHDLAACPPSAPDHNHEEHKMTRCLSVPTAIPRQALPSAL